MLLLNGAISYRRSISSPCVFQHVHHPLQTLSFCILDIDLGEILPIVLQESDEMKCSISLEYLDVALHDVFMKLAYLIFSVSAEAGPQDY